MHSQRRPHPTHQPISVLLRTGDGQQLDPSKLVFQDRSQLLIQYGDAMLDKLFKSDREKMFHEPVRLDLVKDYTKVIEKPMDLGTVRKNLRSGAVYKTPWDIRYDIDLIWSNCFMYNAPNTEYYKRATRLRNSTNQLFHQMMENLEREGAKYPASKYEEIYRQKSAAAAATTAPTTQPAPNPPSMPSPTPLQSPSPSPAATAAVSLAAAQSEPAQSPPQPAVATVAGPAAPPPASPGAPHKPLIPPTQVIDFDTDLLREGQRYAVCIKSEAELDRFLAKARASPAKIQEISVDSAYAKLFMKPSDPQSSELSDTEQSYATWYNAVMSDCGAKSAEILTRLLSNRLDLLALLQVESKHVERPTAESEESAQPEPNSWDKLLDENHAIVEKFTRVKEALDGYHIHQQKEQVKNARKSTHDDVFLQPEAIVLRALSTNITKAVSQIAPCQVMNQAAISHLTETFLQLPAIPGKDEGDADKEENHNQQVKDETQRADDKRKLGEGGVKEEAVSPKKQKMEHSMASHPVSSSE